MDESTSTTAAGEPDGGTTVVDRVFEDFLAHLTELQEIDVAVAERLRIELLEKRNFTVDALQGALFTEEVG